MKDDTLRAALAAFEACVRDHERTGHKSAEAYMDLARSNLLDELSAPAASAAEKIAPVQGYPRGIPWSLHLDAYDAYCKKWGPQPALIDLEERNCRGGFSAGDLDEFIPGWRDKVSEIGSLKAEVAALRVALAAAPQPAIAPAAPVAEAPNRAFALMLLTAASKSGDAHAIQLAAQLGGFPACTGCNYAVQFCRCKPLREQVAAQAAAGSAEPSKPATQEAGPVAWEWFTRNGDHRLTPEEPADYEMALRVKALVYAAPQAPAAPAAPVWGRLTQEETAATIAFGYLSAEGLARAIESAMAAKNGATFKE
jgi:hypothetical protein